MSQENTAKVRPAVPRRIWYFEAHDWGNLMAAHDGARAFFDRLRAIKHEPIEEAARFMRTKTCLLAEFGSSPGVVRAGRWSKSRPTRRFKNVSGPVDPAKCIGPPWSCRSHPRSYLGSQRHDLGSPSSRHPYASAPIGKDRQKARDLAYERFVLAASKRARDREVAGGSQGWRANGYQPWD